MTETKNDPPLSTQFTSPVPKTVILCGVIWVIFCESGIVGFVLDH